MVAPVTRQTQGLLLAFLGTVLLRLSLSDAYLRYVTEWMKWPVLISGVVMILLAIGPIFLDPDDDGHKGHDGHDEHDGHGHRVPRVTWLLVLPGLITFVISPPALGSYLAERRLNQAAAAEPAVVADLEQGATTTMPLQEYVWRAQSGGQSMAERTIELTGFVTTDDAGWYVTRLTLGCCAADARAFRVAVEEGSVDEVPPEDQWVTVTGSYVPGTGTQFGEDPVVAVKTLEQIEKPRQTYE